MTGALRGAKQHHRVIRDFTALNECLRLLTASKIRTVNRLRIESKIIRMKKLLLVKEGCPENREEVFDDLLSHMRRCCLRGEEQDALALLERMRAMLVLFGDEHASH